MRIPQQECSPDPQKIDRKLDARVPSQVESDDDPKVIGGQTKLQDLPVTSQMDNLDIDSKPDYRMPSQEEGSSSIASNDDDDVFDSTGILLMLTVSSKIDTPVSALSWQLIVGECN